jgi:hypothetical protein
MGLNLAFRSHVTWRHYHTAPIQQDYIRPAGCCLVECATCVAGVGAWCRQGRTGDGFLDARGQQQGCENGAQASARERLNLRFLNGSQWK